MRKWAMTSDSFSGQTRESGFRAWLRRAETTLDEYGPAAWIGSMILGFIVFPPLGLVFLGYMLWSGRMGCKGRRARRSAFCGRSFSAGSTGNSAFDNYRDETLRRLEDERKAFDDFMGRLRQAKDQAEFEQFMNERRNAPQQGAPSSGPDSGYGGSSGGFGGAS